MSQSDVPIDQQYIQRRGRLTIDWVNTVLKHLVIAALILMVITSSVGVNNLGLATRNPTEFNINVRLRRSRETPGNVTYEYQFSPPDDVHQLQFDVTGERTVLRSDGFVRESATQWRWDGTTATPKIVVTERVNESGTYGMTAVATGEFAFIDIGDAQDPISWDATGEVSANLTTEPVGEGYVSDAFAYLGPVEQRTIPGTPEMTFIIPEETPLKRRPKTIQRELSALHDRLEIGAEQSTLTVFTPPPPIRQGGAVNGDEFWVQNESPVQVYYHEYAHTRQAFNGDLEEDLTWLVEGSAEYYEIHAQHQLKGIVSADRHGSFSDQLRASEGQTAALTDPTSWGDSLANYKKGAHVLAALDLEIREATDGERSFDDVLRELNRRATDEQRQDPIDYAEFKRVVATVTGESFDDWLDRYVDSTALPPLPENPATEYGTVGDNQPPVAPDHRSTLSPNETPRVNAPGVLVNASDSDGHELIATEVEPAVVSDGTVYPDGTVAVNPDTDSRVITITYRVSDETGATDTGTVTVIFRRDHHTPIEDTTEPLR